MSDEQQDAVWLGFHAGESINSIARAQLLPSHHVRRYLGQTGGIRPAPLGRSARQLSAAERDELFRGLVLGESFRVIGERLGRSHSTVSREVARNGGRQSYRALAADQAAYGRGRRPKPSKLAISPRLCAEVEKNLDLDWSPEQISLRLPLDYPTDHAMRISHETIYLELFLPSRKALHARLVRHLRTGRLMRHANQAKASTAPPRIKNMTLIADRPFAADDRTNPGNWEGDLVMGRRPSAVATLVERSSRYVRLVALPHGIKAIPVRIALVDDLKHIEAGMCRTLTWDRGREMADHVVLTAETGCKVYFCDARSPCSGARMKIPTASSGNISTRTPIFGFTVKPP
jgi:IS30 family transposase